MFTVTLNKARYIDTKTQLNGFLLHLLRILCNFLMTITPLYF